jgi:hypothetical protein
MLLAALVFTACQTLVLSCFAYIAVRWYKRESEETIARISQAAEDFLTPPDADTPSPLALLLDKCALLLSARLVQQVKAMLAGVESGESKGEQLALINEATAGSPWLAMIAGILPKRIRNGLMKNPQMIGALANLGKGNNHQTTDAQPLRRHRE